MPKLYPFRRWLRSQPLAVMAVRCGVSKTTIREWYTGRAAPHALRVPDIIRIAAEDRVNLRPIHLLPARSPEGPTE